MIRGRRGEYVSLESSIRELRRMEFVSGGSLEVENYQGLSLGLQSLPDGTFRAPGRSGATASLTMDEAVGLVRSFCIGGDETSNDITE
jgi:hypothetical protein